MMKLFIPGQRGPKQLYRQRGQGVVGFVIAAAFILVPGILALNYLARVGDTNHKNLQAARYATWERTVWGSGSDGYNPKSDVEIRTEIEQRIFAAHLRPLHSNNDKTSTDRALNRFDPMAAKYQRDGGRRDRSLMMQSADDNDALVQLAATNGEMPGSIGALIVDVAGRTLGLNINGFINSEVSVQLNGTRAISRQWEAATGEEGLLRARAHNAMLIGPWNASGPQGVINTVSRAVPLELLDVGLMDGILEAADAIGFDEFGGLEFGHVDPERVPCHRLANSGDGPSC